jgi:hypothetical protein
MQAPRGRRRRKPMAEYIGATQHIAVRVQPSAAPATRKKNGNKNETHGGINVHNRWDRRPRIHLPAPCRRAQPQLRLINNAYTRSLIVCTQAACAINEPLLPQICANDVTNTVTVIFTQRVGSGICNSPPRAQCQSIRKNREHSLRVRSPFHHSTRKTQVRTAQQPQCQVLSPADGHKVPGTKKGKDDEYSPYPLPDATI